MKTSTKTLATICAVVMSLSLSAQHRTRGNDTQAQTNPAPQDDKKISASAGKNSWNGWGGGVHVNINTYPNYGGGYYSNNNYYSMKKAARNSIRQSAQVIGNALQFTDWNDIYSPWLAKAIRHQQYAKQLYYWGDYAGALNHAERAGFLAWNTLSYFNSGYGYNDYNNGGGYPNPYSDPNNPYYRQSNPDATGTNNQGDAGYRKSNAPENTTATKTEPAQRIQKTEIDNTLPQNSVSDKDLLKMSAKDLDIE